MASVNSRTRERRWIVLGTDGRHVTLGRHSDPSEEEIVTAEHALAAQGGAGWLAILEGDYWNRRSKLSMMMVKPLANPASSFEDAVVAFEMSRKRALQPA